MVKEPSKDTSGNPGEDSSSGEGQQKITYMGMSDRDAVGFVAVMLIISVLYYIGVPSVISWAPASSVNFLGVILPGKLLLTEDFEKDTDHNLLPDEWVISPKDSIYLDVVTYRSPNYSLKMSSHVQDSSVKATRFISSNDGLSLGSVFFLPPSGEDILHITAWVRGENIELYSQVGRGAEFLVHFVLQHNAEKKLHSVKVTSEDLKGSFDWRKVKGKIEVPKGATEISVQIGLSEGSSGTVWFDDVRVYLLYSLW